MTEQQRIDAAMVSDHFRSITDEYRLGLPEITRILMAFFETEKQPTRRVTDIERRKDPIGHGAEELGKNFPTSDWGGLSR